MTTNELSWMIGGPQGSGVNSTAELFAKALCRGGLQVFGNIEYHSNIKGRHSFYRLRVSESPVRSHLEEIDFLVALDQETLFGDFYNEFPTHWGHINEIVGGGGVLYNKEDVPEGPSRFHRDDIVLLPFPSLDLLEEALEAAGKGGQAQKYHIMMNTIAFGANVGILDYDFDFVAPVIQEGFKHKKKVAELNVSAARCAYEHAQANFQSQIPYRLKPIRPTKSQILMKGTQAVGIAKLKAGCAFQTYYPISPATDESVYLEEHQRQYNMTIVQTEDEVAAIDMAVAAAHGGVRSSTSTAGPGFALMPEGVGWAGITESPGPVLCLYQRGGPSTGIPTRHEQGDLRFALHAGQGEFPKIILAPGDIEECFFDTFQAFNYADRYQCPIIILLDKHLATSYLTTEPFDTSQVKVDRGLYFEPGSENGRYLRYRFTQSGITPRSVPGQEGGIFWTTSDEHDPAGHVSEGIANRLAVYEQRMKKMELAEQEIADDDKLNLIGQKKADVTVVSWGSPKGAILDALAAMNSDKEQLNFLQVRLIHPFPATAVEDILSRTRKNICIESNYSGQLAGLIQEKTRVKMHHRVVKFDGRPFSVNEVTAAVKAALDDGGEHILVSEGEVRNARYGEEQVDSLLQEKSSRPMKAPSVPLPPGYNR